MACAITQLVMFTFSSGVTAMKMSASSVSACSKVLMLVGEPASVIRSYSLLMSSSVSALWSMSTMS